MEVVRVFNNELSSLYEAKPPISKAKMTQITKSAIKGIKFYKHIVQSVEKFIQKCRPEYKVPGLYVVDSIVRQSRHQFGADKDVFGPRFVKSINLTFQHLFKCNPDDRPKIIRVLNLWQRNAVFPIEIIQPLLDMGHPNSASEWPSEPSSEVKESPHKSYPPNEKTHSSRHESSDSQHWKGWPQANDEPVQDTHTYAEMSKKNLEKFMKAEMTNAIEEEAARSSHFRNQAKQDKIAEENTVKFNKKLLDFDYGDEEDEEEGKNDDNLPNTPNALAMSMAQNLLSNPELLRQLQQMQQLNEALHSDLGQPPLHMSKPDVNDSSYSSDVPLSPQQPPLPTYEAPHMPLPPLEADKDDRVLPQPPLPPQDLDERSLAALMLPHGPLPPTTVGVFPPSGIALSSQTEGDRDDRIIPDSAAPSRDLDERSLAAILAPLERGILPPMPFTEASSMIPYQSNVPFPPQQPPLPLMEPMSLDAAYPPALPPDQHIIQGSQADEDERMMYSMPGEPPLPPQDFDERTIMMPMEERSRKDRSRSRSGSRSRGRSGRHRSRSKSPRRKRSRSRSRSRKNSRAEERERIREKERDRERERDRRKKGLPPVKKGCVTVCSTTLWLGHVPKSCTGDDISSVFGDFGKISSIDMIPPRGCAYVVMDSRQDAHKAIQKLKNLKLQTSTVKMAWAPGKGVKGKEYKDCWEVEAGVSYVPYDRIPEDAEALDLLEEGGFIDEESLTENLKAVRNQVKESVNFTVANKISMDTVTTTYNPMHGPPMVPPPIIPPPASVNLPGMVLPHMMQPQFGMPMPGMLPPQAMMMQMPMGIPPPNSMLMVQQQSQNMLNHQSLPMGLPQMIPRAIPPVPSALQNLKTAETAVSSPVIPSANAGDATPTDEDGTSISSPSTMHLTNSVTNSSMSVSTAQAIPITQFNPLMGLQNSNRPMMPMPPPVSAAGTPIPYPPPNVNFSFPPPGVRPPGQALQNPQYPWMQQKPAGPPFNDSESSQSVNSVGSRTAPQPGMPPQMFANRPFQEKLPSTQTPSKDTHDSGNLERKSSDMDISGNRSSSPGHHDMVISTDDESSLDRDFPRNDVSAGPRFQGPTEFPGLPMHHMRGPPGPIQGMHFQRGGPMGSPFPIRMGGPRGMVMHPGQQMEMDFPMHPGPPGPRMPGGPRRENMPPPQEERDWYPRDFDGPPYERDNRFERDEWPRDSWTTPEKREMDSRKHSLDHEDRDYDERRGARNHRGEDKVREDSHDKHKPYEDIRDNAKQASAKKSKPNNTKSLMDDMFKLRFYQRDKKPDYASHLSKSLESKKKEVKERPIQKDSKEERSSQKPKDENCTLMDRGPVANSPRKEQLPNSRREKDREARKRSRWGRTLSEERDFQEQRRNELEMKFQSYEKSSREMQNLLPTSTEVPCDNSIELNNSAPEPGGETSNSMPECDIEKVQETDCLASEPSETLETETVEQTESETHQTQSETLLTEENVCSDESAIDTEGAIPECPTDTDNIPEEIPNVNDLSMISAES